MEDMCDVLGLRLPKGETWEPFILELVQKREEARKSRNWALSDQLRNELKTKGVLVEDSPTGPRLKRI
jgi:cysteinyl-tRNA synthetase